MARETTNMDHQELQDDAELGFVLDQQQQKNTMFNHKGRVQARSPADRDYDTIFKSLEARYSKTLKRLAE